jgi:hypothetical protein
MTTLTTKQTKNEKPEAPRWRTLTDAECHALSIEAGAEAMAPYLAKALSLGASGWSGRLDGEADQGAFRIAAGKLAYSLSLVMLHGAKHRPTLTEEQYEATYDENANALHEDTHPPTTVLERELSELVEAAWRSSERINRL